MAKQQSSPYNSFVSGNSKLFPTEKYNYVDTSVDMVENVNKQIDDNIADFKDHIKQVIAINNQHYSNQQNNLNKLISLTPKAANLAKWSQQQSEAREMAAPLWDAAANARLQEENAQLTFEEDQSAFQYIETGAAAKEVEQINSDPDLMKGLLLARGPNISNRAAALDDVRQYPLWFEQLQEAQDIIYPDGRTGRLSTADTYQDAQFGYNQIVGNYLAELLDAGRSKRHINKYIIPEILKARDTYMKKWVDAHTAAIKVEAREARKSELQDAVLEGGEGLSRFMKTYHGYHNGSWTIGRAETFTMIGELIKEGRLEYGEVEDMMQDIIMGNDGQPHVIDEYWAKDPYLSELKKIIRNGRWDAFQAKQRDEELALSEFKDREITTIREGNEPPTEEYMENLQAQHIAAFGKKADWIDNYLTKQDIKDEDIDRELSRRYRNGEILKSADIDGITDIEMWVKWKKVVQESGMTKDQITNRDKWLDGQVKVYTEDETLDKARTNPLWIAVRQQATDIFNAKYRAERNAGQTHEVADSLAKQETAKVIKGGTLDTFPILERDEKRANDIFQMSSAISKDRNIIFDSQPLQGEELPLKEALTYYQTGRGNIPEYYRRAASFYKNITPYELMMHRLITTGVLKNSDVESLPERELPPEQQDLLLNKTSPARTLRSFASDDGEALNNLVAVSSYETPEQLTNVLRANAERNNQYSGWDISLVNIDPDLLEEHNQVVGEQSPFDNLNTMLPGVATAYVEDKYNV